MFESRFIITYAHWIYACQKTHLCSPFNEPLCKKQKFGLKNEGRSTGMLRQFLKEIKDAGLFQR